MAAVLRRAGSFGRRSDRSKERQIEAEQPPPDLKSRQSQSSSFESELAEGEGVEQSKETFGIVGKIRRSSSFQRGAKLTAKLSFDRKKRGKSKATEGDMVAVRRASSADTNEEDESSIYSGVGISEDGRKDSSYAESERPSTPPYDGLAPGVVLPSPCPGMLHGYLKKMHHHSGVGAGSSALDIRKKSAQRYFVVDEVRGTLSYAKSQTKTPKVVLPLADITSVRYMENSQTAFKISCPPVHLSVQADDREEREMWVNGLSHRVLMWREKALASGIAATRIDSVRQDSFSEPASMEAVNGVVAGSCSRGPSTDASRPPTMQVEVQSRQGYQKNYRSQENDGYEDDSASQGQRHGQVRIGMDALDARSTRMGRSISSGWDEPRDHAPAPEAKTSYRKARSAARAIEHSRVETVELQSSSDEEEPPNKHSAISPSRNKAATRVAPRDLASMMSSSEEDDDLLPRPAANAGRRKHSRCVPSDACSGAPAAPALAANEPASCQYVGASDEGHGAAAVAPVAEQREPRRSWLSSMPDSVYGLDDIERSSEYRPRREADGGSLGLSSPRGGYSLCGSAPVSVAAGLEPDANFVNDSWDD